MSIAIRKPRPSSGRYDVAGATQQPGRAAVLGRHASAVTLPQLEDPTRRRALLPPELGEYHRGSRSARPAQDCPRLGPRATSKTAPGRAVAIRSGDCACPWACGFSAIPGCV